MKRLTGLFLAFLLAFLPLTGCTQSQVNGALDLAGEALQAVESTQAASATPAAEAPASNSAPAAESADVDLSDMPETVTGVETLSAGTPIDEEGWYSSRDEVALYIMAYGTLPGNFMTKKQAQALGWEGGGLDDFAPGKSIGGDHFGNYEGALPDGHSYTECDIDTQNAKKRGAKRLIFSEDGLIFYTADHYETFTLLVKGD